MKIYREICRWNFLLLGSHPTFLKRIISVADLFLIIPAPIETYVYQFDGFQRHYFRTRLIIRG